MNVDKSECNCAQTNLSNENLKQEIIRLKKEKNAVILGHFYQRDEIQDVADYIGDSLALAQIAEKIEQPLIIMCGVHFMAETTKILCPDKKVLIPDTEAGCSLADSCPAKELAEFKKAHPDHKVISYVNTTAAVKALTDVVVTSSNARQIVESFPADTKLIFGPDRNLGGYINSITGRDMLLWNGSCHVHEQFSLDKLVELKQQYPDAKVLVHPECPRQIVMMADKVGSTAALLNYSKSSDAKRFIVVTESGILHQMRQASPDKEFIPAPPMQSNCGCNDCNYMKMITLEKLLVCLRDEINEVNVDAEIAEEARKPIKRMLEISASLGL